MKPTNNVPVGVVHNPITKSPFTKTACFGHIAPGVAQLVVTDDMLNVTTDDGEFVST